MKAIREAKHLTMREVASRANVPLPTVHQIEHGWRPQKSDAPMRIAAVLGVTVDDLYAVRCPYCSGIHT